MAERKIAATIDKHGLTGLSDVMQKTNCFIAGSYSIPFEDLMVGADVPDDRDIDLWFLTEEGINYSQRLSTLVRFLVEKGYSWPRVVALKNAKGETSHYKRMETSIYTMYTLKCETREDVPPIQILILTPSAGSTPEEIVRNFDLTLMMRWYDGNDVIILPEAARALENRVLEINVSQDIKDQNIYEWIRTAQRFQKYIARDFKIQWQSDPLNDLLTNAAATSIYIAKGNIVYERLLAQWNNEIRELGHQLPYLGLTMCPPATTLSHLRVFWTLNNIRFQSKSNPHLAWSELTKQEQESAIPVVVHDRMLVRTVHINTSWSRVNAATYFESP